MHLLENLHTEDLLNKTIFIRVDFNVPLQQRAHGRYLVADDERIRRFLDTTFKRIHQLTQGNCRIIIGSHLGRPHKSQGHAHWDGIFNLQFVCSHFETLMKKEYEDSYIVFPPEAMDSQLTDSLEILKKNQLPLGGIKFLPNLRYLLEKESEYREKFVENLADMCDVYINCAFGTSHRDSRSITALPRIMKKKGKIYVAGLLLSEEVSKIGGLGKRIIQNPSQTIFIAGGSKVSDKIGILKEVVLSGVSRVLLGGKMVNAFLLAQNSQGTPRELPEKLKPKKKEDEESVLKEVQLAWEILETAREKGVEIVFPVDYKVAPDFQSGKFKTVESPDFQNELQLDIGKKTIQMYAKMLLDDKVRNVFWNGPLGAFDHPTNDGYAEGSVEIGQCLYMKCLREGNSLVVIGGGDTAAVVHQFNFSETKRWIEEELRKMISTNINQELFGINFMDRDLYTFLNYFAKNFFISTGGGASLEFLEAFLKDKGQSPLGNYLPGTKVLEE